MHTFNAERLTPRVARRFAALTCIGLAAAASLAACGSKDSGSAAAAPAAGAGRPAGDSSHRGGRGGPGGGGRQQTITLAPTDVAVATTQSIEEATALTGDLRPIETVNVRSRIEGDLLALYVREGQQVTAGQLLGRFESVTQESSQRSAEADRAAARSDLSTAQWNLEQNAQLFKAGAISERDFKIAQQAVETSRARLAATEARVRESSNTARDTRVLAPTSGIVDKRLVEAGEHVSRGAPLLTIVRNDVLELAAAVPAKQANAVRVGQVVHFVADARSFDGRVARVSPTIDPVSRAITVYAQVPNPGGALRGGTFAAGRVVSRTIPSALTVPTSALHQRQEDGRSYVYRVAGKAVDVVPVDLGVVDERGNKAEVVSGLSEGDRVIVGNVGVLGKGVQVSIAGEGGVRQARPARDAGAPGAPGAPGAQGAPNAPRRHTK